MSCLWLLQVLQSFFSHANLNRVNTIFLFCLDLSDLAPVDLYDCAWHYLSPLVPEVSHPDLVPKQTDPPTVSVRCRSLLQLVLLVDFVFKAHKRLLYIRYTMTVRQGYRCIVKYFCLR